jgi:hypothetical protein
MEIPLDECAGASLAKGHPTSAVIPAKAGIQFDCFRRKANGFRLSPE